MRAGRALRWESSSWGRAKGKEKGEVMAIDGVMEE